MGVEPLLRCGSCKHCAAGRYNQCQVAGGLIGMAVDGGMAQQVIAPQQAVFAAPQGIDGELAAIAEPLACSVHGFEEAKLAAGETVLVIGAGSIGLTAQLAAQAYGAQTIVLARYPHQQQLARDLGAAEVIGDDDAGKQRLAELAADDAIDVVAECVGGHADTIRTSVDAVRRLGRVVVLGVFAIEERGTQPADAARARTHDHRRGHLRRAGRARPRLSEGAGDADRLPRRGALANHAPLRP